MDDIVFIGNWTKDRILGSGSFGVVTLWKHNQTDEKLAIKVCKWGDELTTKHRERWSNEVEMMKNFNNENIVATKPLPSEFLRGLSVCNPSDLPMLCMEYCSGGDLRRVLNRPESCFGLREYDVRQILHDVSTAVRFLHDHNITHRDLKPENIVLQPLESPNSLGRSVVYKLIDLGYAKEIDSKSVCASFVGTLQYLAPELFYSKTYSNSVDFWSLGLLTYEVICGERPFLTNLAPVQWMEHVKQKSSEDIRVYENYRKVIEYSSEICPENRVSAPFKLSIEKWLRVALEWDHKKRGYAQSKLVKFALPCDGQYSKQNIETAKTDGLVIFTLLQNILSKKIINIFSSYTYSQISYEIDDSVLISTLKRWIERDIKVMCADQMLISFNIQNKVIDSDFAVKYWNDQSKPVLFLYHKEKFLKSDIQPNVSMLIKCCLEQPKMLFNYNSGKELYKNCFYFVNSEKNLYESMITACIIRIEDLKLSAKRLLVMHNETDKCVGKLLFSQDILTNILNTNKSKISVIKTANIAQGNNLDCLNATGDELLDNISKLQEAWGKLTTRMQSALRRSSEINSVDIHNKLNSKNEFKICYAEAYNAYISFRKREKDFRMVDASCPDVVKCSYKCLKLRDAILQDLRMQQFVQKILDIDLEIGKMHNIIETSSVNTAKLSAELKDTVIEIHTALWNLVGNENVKISYKSEESQMPMTISSYFDESNNMEVEYSFRKNDFIKNSIVEKVELNNELVSLVEDSMTLRRSYAALKQKREEQKSLIESDLMEFVEKI